MDRVLPLIYLLITEKMEYSKNIVEKTDHEDIMRLVKKAYRDLVRGFLSSVLMSKTQRGIDR